MIEPAQESALTLAAKFAGGLIAFFAAHVEPNVGVWFGAVAAALLSPSLGADRAALEIARHFVAATLIGVFGAQLALPVAALAVAVPPAPLAFILGWAGPPMLNAFLAAVREGRANPATMLNTVVDRFLTRFGL